MGETAVGCDTKCRMLATLGTRMRFGYRSGWGALGDKTAGLDGERALQAVRNTPSFRVLGCQPRLGDQGRGQRTVTERPRGGPGQPAVCKGAAGGRCRRVRTVLGNAGMGGEMSSPEKYYGLHWGIWGVAGPGGRCEDRGRRHPLRRRREQQHPRPVHPPSPGLFSPGSSQAHGEGKGEGAFTWLCRGGSQAPGSASHLALSSPPPSSTQFGPPVP